MKKLFNGLDRYLRLRILITLVMNAGFASIAPVLVKERGLLWTVSLVSASTMIKSVSGLFAIRFRGLQTKTLAISEMSLTVVYTSILPLYFVSPLLLIWMALVVGIIGRLITTAADVAILSNIATNTDKGSFKTFSHLDKMASQFGILLGGGLLILIMKVLDIKWVIITAVTIHIVGFILRLYVYISYKHDKYLE